jgi:hypothetical protein
MSRIIKIRKVEIASGWAQYHSFRFKHKEIYQGYQSWNKTSLTSIRIPLAWL